MFLLQVIQFTYLSKKAVWWERRLYHPKKKVHGREIMQGWVPLMVTEILPSIRPWPEYPTHSSEVEKNSFVAWLEQHLRRRGEKQPFSSQVEVLKDPLRPDRDVSLSTLVSHHRQLRERIKTTQQQNMFFIHILKGL